MHGTFFHVKGWREEIFTFLRRGKFCVLKKMGSIVTACTHLCFFMYVYFTSCLKQGGDYFFIPHIFLFSFVCHRKDSCFLSSSTLQPQPPPRHKGICQLKETGMSYCDGQVKRLRRGKGIGPSFDPPPPQFAQPSTNSTV